MQDNVSLDEGRAITTYRRYLEGRTIARRCSCLIYFDEVAKTLALSPSISLK